MYGLTNTELQHTDRKPGTYQHYGWMDLHRTATYRQKARYIQALCTYGLTNTELGTYRQKARYIPALCMDGHTQNCNIQTDM